MKRATNTHNNLLIKQIKNISRSDLHLKQIVADNNSREKAADCFIELVRPQKRAVENNGKPEKIKLYIKNMVSIRCKIVVKAVLDNLRLNYSKVDLGEVDITGPLSDRKLEQLRSDLLKFGLELLGDKKSIIVEKIKSVIIEMIHYADELPNIKFSYYLSEKLNYDYTYLANLFSEVKGMSIQHFIIEHKIERVKELMMYENLTLTEIAWKLHYSSVAHLSIQFKKITGLTPTHFKRMRHKRRKALEDV